MSRYIIIDIFVELFCVKIIGVFVDEIEAVMILM